MISPKARLALWKPNSQGHLSFRMDTPRGAEFVSVHPRHYHYDGESRSGWKYTHTFWEEDYDRGGARFRVWRHSDRVYATQEAAMQSAMRHFDYKDGRGKNAIDHGGFLA